MKRMSGAPLLTIGAAILLPILIFLGLQFALSAREERSAAEAAARAASERIVVEADARLQRSLAILDAFGPGQAIATRDWETLYDRLVRLRATEEDWVTARLVDLGSGETLFDLRSPFGAGAPAGSDLPLPRARPSGGGAFVGSVGGRGGGCPCALIHAVFQPEAGAPVMLTLALDTEPFLAMLRAHTDPERTSALVGPEGLFVARSRDHERRAGTPATVYVRRAIATGPEGIYRGRTYEGFANYTAYSTSRLSGWSAHIAFSPGLLDSPRWRSLAAAGVAALASIGLALALVWLTLRRIAEARRVEERLQEAQKMEALGQITGGIAHDFNNLMTPIVGGLDLLARSQALDARGRRLAESALASARKAARLTGQLLAFSRRQKMEIAPVPLAALIGDALPLLEQSAGARIRVVTEPVPAELCVESDSNQLQLALLNLVVNARDAMPDGGTIRIAVDEEREGGRATGLVAIRVSDEGVGMPPEVRARALEPFFTTKPPGSGTGLGLAQVYGTVRQSGGTVEIDSAPGRGTAVTLRLAACPPGTPPVAAAAAPIEADGGGARILLCDDDDAVRAFAARALDEAGYVVEAVSDGRSAVELVRNAAPALLVVDFAMHGMNGAEVVRAARRIRPGLPALIITGYVDSDAVASGAEATAVLRKPFDAHTLCAAVAEALPDVSRRSEA